MADITLREQKGSPLTSVEVDANFTNLNEEVGQKLDAAEYTALDVLNKLKTVDGSGSGLDADLLDGLSTASTNTQNTVVIRDSNGDFSGNTITAVGFVGPLTGNVVGNLTGTVTGNSSNVDGVVDIANGGTGATTATNARTALGLGSMAIQNKSTVQITGGTISGITDLAVADGGTGASNASSARTNLGLAIGTDVQPFSNGLTAFAGITTTGIVIKTGTGTATTRSVTASTNVSVSNGTGVSGNIAITGTETPTIRSITHAGTSGTGDIGSSGSKFGTFWGVASSANYGDLAEKYLPDQQYAVGTVMRVGGEAEITSSVAGCKAIGVISEKPGFRMNEGLEGGVFVALKGRVPVRCIGEVSKGDQLIPADGGLAVVGNTNNVFAVALGNKSGDEEGLVEAIIL